MRSKGGSDDRTMRAAVSGFLVLFLIPWLGEAPSAALGSDAPTMELVANFPYGAGPVGTVRLAEMEVDGEVRDYAFTRTSRELLVLDVTDRSAPVVASKTECVRAFREASIDVRADLGLAILAGHLCGTSPSKSGVVLYDISDPRKPKFLSQFLYSNVSVGNKHPHTVTLHPRKPYAYVASLQQYPTSGEQIPAANWILDISDPLEPKPVADFTYHVSSAHEIHFDPSGTRAYVAAVTHTDIWDTTDPTKPRVISSIHDPSNKWHNWARPTADGKYLLVGDAPTSPDPVCPSGLLHIYDITSESMPVPAGVFSIARAPSAQSLCALGYFDVDPRTGLLGVPWGIAGTYLLDPSDPRAVGTRELTHSELPQQQATSSTFFEGDLFTVDVTRGLDIFRIGTV